MKNIITLSLLGILFNACGQKHADKKPVLSIECIDLNNQGTKYLTEPVTFWKSKNTIDTVISLFRQAINCDTNYLIAYINLSHAYDRKQDYKAELSVLKKVLYHSNNFPGFILQEGIVYEKLNAPDSASKAYKQAKIAYEKKLSVSPNDIETIKKLIYLKALTLNKDSAINELNRQAILHPHLSIQLKQDLDFYKYFDRKSITNHSSFDGH